LGEVSLHGVHQPVRVSRWAARYGAMEEAQFEIEDVEALRAHYAITLERWVNRLERHHEQALRYVNEATYRVWRLYMSACALDFRSGEIGVYQVLARKRASEAAALPLTRRHVYQ